MDFQNHLKIAWEKTLQFVVPAMLLTLVYILVCIFSASIMAPVTTAGYQKSLMLALRENRTPEIGDLFSEMHLFLPLTVTYIVIFIAIFIGLLLLVLPGLLMSIALGFGALYVIPLMLDKDMPIIDALKESWAMAVRKPITDQIVILLISSMVGSIGNMIPFGGLFAIPMATIFILSTYDWRMQNGQKTITQPAAAPPPPPQPEKPEAPQPPPEPPSEPTA